MRRFTTWQLSLAKDFCGSVLHWWITIANCFLDLCIYFSSPPLLGYWRKQIFREHKLKRGRKIVAIITNHLLVQNEKNWNVSWLGIFGGRGENNKQLGKLILWLWFIFEGGLGAILRQPKRLFVQTLFCASSLLCDNSTNGNAKSGLDLMAEK